MNGSRSHKTCELYVFFGDPLIIMKKAFVSNLICISHFVQYESNKRANESKSESKSKNEKSERKRARERERETDKAYQNENTTQMNGKKAYKVPISDNSISILLHSSAVSVMYCTQ